MHVLFILTVRILLTVNWSCTIARVRDVFLNLLNLNFKYAKEFRDGNSLLYHAHHPRKSLLIFSSLWNALSATLWTTKKYGEIWIKRICVTTETTQFHKLSAGNDNRSRAVYKQWTTEAARTKGPPEYIYINILSPRPANTIDKRGIWIMKEDAIYLFVYLCMYARVI